MSYEIQFEQRGGFVHALVTGENSKENISAYLADIRAECEKTDCYRILVEENLEGPRLATFDVIAVASEGATAAPGIFEAVAYVDMTMSNPRLDFLENVVINRGMPVAIFDSVKKAEQWLSSRQSDDKKIFDPAYGDKSRSD